MSICFITGAEGSGTTALVRALANHPDVVKGDEARYGHPMLRGAAGAQLIPAALMSTHRACRFDLPDPAAARYRLRNGAARFFAAQPGTRAIAFKYSTPAFRPPLWPVFLPLFDVPGFRVIVIWRRPLDTIYSAFRRFYRGRGSAARQFLAATRSYLDQRRHLRWQLARSPRDRWLALTYEGLTSHPEAGVRRLCRFAELEYRSPDQLLPGRGFSNENGKWKQALRNRLTPRPASGRDTA